VLFRSKYKFEWIKNNDLFIPYLVIGNNKYQICNLHIHSKNVSNFIANNLKINL
jgi:hypothetical protein